MLTINQNIQLSYLWTAIYWKICQIWFEFEKLHLWLIIWSSPHNRIFLLISFETSPFSSSFGRSFTSLHYLSNCEKVKATCNALHDFTWERVWGGFQWIICHHSPFTMQWGANYWANVLNQTRSNNNNQDNDGKGNTKMQYPSWKPTFSWASDTQGRFQIFTQAFYNKQVKLNVFAL